MKTAKNTGSFIAAVLLLLLTFGITPKRLLHQLFADHPDTGITHAIGQHQQLSPSGLHCDCNDQVATGFYLYLSPTPAAAQKITIQSPVARYYQNNITAPPVYFSLRGPPAIS